MDDVPSMGWDDPEGNTEVRQSAETFDTENGIALLSANNEKKIKAYGIDVSQHNGDIDWEKVKNFGVDFAIIRVGGRGYVLQEIFIKMMMMHRRILKVH